MAEPEPQINSRRELYDYLHERMNRSYSQLLDAGRFEQDTTTLKSFLLEADWTPGQLADDESATIQRLCTVPPGVGRRPSVLAGLRATDEQGFYIVDWRDKGTRLRMYLDTASDPGRRFWVGYTLSDARQVDLVLSRLVDSHAHLDRVWLWPRMLLSTQGKGQFRGVGLDYDYRRFERYTGSEASDYLKMALWGGDETKDIYEYICQHKDFGAKAVLAKVRMRYDVNCDPEGPDEFSLEEIKYNGKFTTKGTSFAAHLDLVNRVRDAYRGTISDIERRHRPGGDDCGLAPEPVFFELDGRPVDDLDAFCNAIFSATQPFRLWGSVEAAGSGRHHRVVTAVDLHTGSSLVFEVYPRLICMYLDSASCGNTVVRFYTNLQHTLGTRVEATDNDGRPVL